MCVNKEVRINEDHRKASSSAVASTSATSSKLPARQRPSETPLVRKAFLGRAGGSKDPSVLDASHLNHGLEASLTKLLDSFQESGYVTIKAQRRSHASKHINCDVVMS
jgi:hypothetical protein